MTSSFPAPYPQSSHRSTNKVRQLHAHDLGLTLLSSTEISDADDNTETDAALNANEAVDALEAPTLMDDDARRALAGMADELSDDDAYLVAVRSLLKDGYAGIIFTGPPGTSKSWYAARIAAKLAGSDPRRVRFVQFHPSYQYEDFVEGYVPRVDGFDLVPKHLLQMCEVAERAQSQLCFLVIDELSRCDPGRVFGEALTYIEMSKRNQRFRVASGREVHIPSNLLFLATMNPFDRSVDEVDAAFERRFAKIAMDPNRELLRRVLTENKVDSSLQHKIVNFFEQLRNHPNPLARVGHAYFTTVKDIDSLHRLWDHQLRFQLEKALRLDPAEFSRLQADWKRMFPSSPGAATTPTAPKVGVPEAARVPTERESSTESLPAGESTPPLDTSASVQTDDTSAEGT